MEQHKKNDIMNELEHLAGNVYVIKGKMMRFSSGLSFIPANTLFINDTEKAVIDPASDLEILKKLSEQFSIEHCIFSHYHFDHSFSYYLFGDAIKYIHKVERNNYPFFKQLVRTLIFLYYPWKEVYNYLLTRDFFSGWRILWEIRMLWLWPNKKFRDGDILEIGTTRIEVIHAPGHSKGHTCFYFPDEKILYSADYDLSSFGPWYGQRDSDIDELIASIEKIKKMDISILVTGHHKGVVTEEIFERLDDFLRIIDEREERILNLLDSRKTVRGLFNKEIIYSTTDVKKDNFLSKSAQLMIKKHLKRMQKKGLVKKRFGKWVRV